LAPLVRLGEPPAASADPDSTELYDEAQDLLVRTTELTARCGLVLARGR
jgi:hypothetical protein